MTMLLLLKTSSRKLSFASIFAGRADCIVEKRRLFINVSQWTVVWRSVVNTGIKRWCCVFHCKKSTVNYMAAGWQLRAPSDGVTCDSDVKPLVTIIVALTSGWPKIWRGRKIVCGPKTSAAASLERGISGMRGWHSTPELSDHIWKAALIVGYSTFIDVLLVYTQMV